MERPMFVCLVEGVHCR